MLGGGWRVRGMTKVHLDTDLGGDPDDLCALALLLSWPGLEITGITTTADQGGQRAGYVRYALGLAGRSDIPVAAGADAVVGHCRYSVEFPDEAAFWPEPMSPTPPASPTDALALLKRSADAGATVIGIGPYTNLALLDRAYPALLQRVPLFLMGGAIHPIPPEYPQWENDADWNIQYDVTAAQSVLEQGRPTLIPLEISVRTALRRAFLPRLRRSGPLGALIARQAEAFALAENYEERYGRACTGLPDDLINFQHDPLACAVALGWAGVTIEEIPLRIERRDGWLHERIAADGRLTPVVTAVDGLRFNQFWLDLVTGRA